MDTIEARVRPHSVEYEQAILGACMIEMAGMQEVADVLKAEMFYVRSHALIWKAIEALYRRRDPIDLLTVFGELKRAGIEENAYGGAFYLSQVTNKVAGATNIVFHAHMVIQHYIAREAIRIGSEMMTRGYEPTCDPFDTISGASSEIRLLHEHGQVSERTMSEVMVDVVDGNQPDRAIRFGFDAIDEKVRAEPGCVTIIGARPAMGKTAFMLSSAWRQACLGHRPYIAEMEMRDRNLATRLICGECTIPVWKAKRRLLNERDEMAMANWAMTHNEALSRMVVDESASMTVSSLAARLDRAKRKRQIDVVWIDYIGLLQPSTKQRPGYDRMTAISNELRVLAKETDLPFIVLAQLNRPVKGASVKPPILTDLRDSGEIEQDAEAVCFLHRPKYYDQGADDTVDFIVAKNRDGEDGIAHLTFDGPGVRMLDHHKIEPLPSMAYPDNRIDDQPF